MESTRQSHSPLLTLPPEILLTIISYLPTSSALYTLSTTSHTLSSFIHTHASTICNTRIQSERLLFRASLILKSSYIDGWLVPQHRSIFQAEEQWKQELESRNASRATSPQCLQLNLGSCCFRSASVGSNSTAPRANRVKKSILVSQSQISSASKTSSTRRLATRPAKYITSSPSKHHTKQLIIHPIKHNTILSPSLPTSSTFNLSQPGPHYLTFLERYASEIVARWEMDIGRSTRPETPVVIKHGAFATQLGTIDELDDEEEMEQMELQFASMLRLYCMRNWMMLCWEMFEGGGGKEDEDGMSLSGEEVKGKRGRVLAGRIKDKFGWAVRRGREKLLSMRKTFARRNTPPPRKRLLFGEIDTDSASSLASAGIISSSTSLVEKDYWVKGLLWYYGVAGRDGGHLEAGSLFVDTTPDSTRSWDEKVIARSNHDGIKLTFIEACY